MVIRFEDRPEHEREYILERAGIRENEGEQNKHDAYSGAIADLVKRKSQSAEWNELYGRKKEKR